MPPDRWFGVGFCGDARAAGARAADDALVHDDPKLLIVFCSQAYDLRQLLGQIRERAGDVPLIGCTTAGQIATVGPSDTGVVVTALGGSGFAVRTTAAPPTRPGTCGRREPAWRGACPIARISPTR